MGKWSEALYLPSSLLTTKLVVQHHIHMYYHNPNVQDPDIPKLSTINHLQRKDAHLNQYETHLETESWKTTRHRFLISTVLMKSLQELVSTYLHWTMT